MLLHRGKQCNVEMYGSNTRNVILVSIGVPVFWDLLFVFQWHHKTKFLHVSLEQLCANHKIMHNVQR